MYKEILVPLDGSDLAGKAVPYARDLAKALGCRVTLIGVVETDCVVCPWPVDPAGVAAVYEAVAEERKAQVNRAREYLEGKAEELRNEGVDATPVVLDGDPGSVICDYAGSIRADMIVMSTHGRTGIPRWVYGSVAAKVLHGADVPILLVRAYGEQQ
jgi:nucleotide-binding universal stress UspA family protein